MLGNLKGIRENSNRNGNASSMPHSLWPFSHIIQRFREKAEEHGIRVVEASEHRSSSTSPRCRSSRVIKRGRLFNCMDCGVEANRDP